MKEVTVVCNCCGAKAPERDSVGWSDVQLVEMVPPNEPYTRLQFDVCTQCAARPLSEIVGIVRGRLPVRIAAKAKRR